MNRCPMAGQHIAMVPFNELTSCYFLIGQQSLSRGAYQFWQKVQALTGNVGSIFDATPSTLTGNIKNQNPYELPMLGYFQVSARELRIVYMTRLVSPKLPFAETIFLVCPECEPRNESLYPTAIKPEGWR